LQLDDIVVDGCITKAPCGEEMAGRSPADRGKQGTKRSILVDAAGIPLGVVQAPANRNDSPLLASTLDTLADRALPPGETTVHLDRGYDSGKTRTELDRRGQAPCIAKLGKPAPLRATSRWVVERTNAWHNAFKKLAWCTFRTLRAGNATKSNPRYATTDLATLASMPMLSGSSRPASVRWRLTRLRSR
jgi:IS5 family transposase